MLAFRLRILGIKVQLLVVRNSIWTCFTPSTAGDSYLTSFVLPSPLSHRDVMKYHSHVIIKYGLVIIKHVDSFFSSFKIWNSCWLAVVKESVTFNFNEIRLLAVGVFNELGLREVFEHGLGYMVFKFISRKHMLKTTVSGSLFVECDKHAFEVFFSNNGMRECIWE